MVVNILPPLHIIKRWRDEGLSPVEVYRRCEEFVRPRRVARVKILWCSLCGAKHLAKGLCRKCYDKARRQSLKVRNIKTPA